jgi:membrane-bound lytic murein transglycosylase D
MVLSTAQAEEHPYTPVKKDFTENGVPFVVDVQGENSDEANRSEMPTKAQATVEADDNDSKFTQVTDEDTPVSHEEIAGEKNVTNSRPWKAPDFSNQDTALGYSSNVFATPKGMETNVKFWIDVYSKYTTDQGVLHDSDYIDLIYQELDFSSVTSRTDINNFQKERIKIKMVKDGKARVLTMLQKFQKLKDPSGLNPAERKVWDYFEKIKDPKKFKAAAGKGRLRFQLGQKDRVIQGIYFSGRYIEDFEKIFREAGMPVELVRLPFVESSYNVLARSKVGASGLWQIMPYTMKGFMKKDPSVDLRNHPISATRTAAKLLRINYNMLQSWPLAMTGWNHGPSGVLRLTKKYKTRELGELIQNPNSKMKFGFASRNFYASFLAVLEVTSHAPQYLGPVTWSQPLDAADIKLPIDIKYKDIVRWFDGDDLKAQIFNPQITRVARSRARPIPRGMIVSVAKAKLEVVMKELESPESLKKAQAAAVAEGRMPSGDLIEPPMKYLVRRGDTLKKLSEEYGATVSELMELNHLKKGARLKPGRWIEIP